MRVGDEVIGDVRGRSLEGPDSILLLFNIGGFFHLVHAQNFLTTDGVSEYRSWSIIA